MNSYLIRDIDLRTIDRLNQASIEWLDWDENSILVSTTPEEIMRAVGAESFETNAAEWEDIFTITFKFPPPPIPNQTQVGRKKLDPELAKSRENYIKHAGVRHKESIVAAQNAYSNQAKELLKTETKFLQAARKQFVFEQGQNQQALAEKFKEEYKKLTALPQVRAVVWNAGEIQIYTNTLHILHTTSGASFALGAFLIIINCQDANGFLTCLNQTRVVNTPAGKMQAPYIMGNGQPAPHDLMLPITELIAQMEFTTAIELLLQLLETACDDHLGNMVTHWPQIGAASY